MKILLFGATGMVGQGVLRECLLDPDVTQVISIGRTPAKLQNPKFRDLINPDLYNYSSIEDELTGIDACFFCLGATAAGKSEADYTRITYELTLAAAQVLARLNPQMTFIYVSGRGTNAAGAAMWQRVKGRTENALLALPLRACMFRPGIIQPLHGIKSKTPLYNVFYTLAWPIMPLIHKLDASTVTTAEVGRAMLQVAKHGAPKPILEAHDIRALGTAQKG